MNKERFYLNASAIGSYLGVGFNTPEEQFLIDSGEVVKEYTQEELERMELGNYLENGALDFFEFKFQSPIYNRNVELNKSDNGFIQGKVDGMILFDGEECVFENKISNAQTKFTENINYMLQVQAYMLLTNTNKAILGGLSQGKPIFDIIDRNEETIADIVKLSEIVTSALSGIGSLDDLYESGLIEKYSEVTKLEDFEEVDEFDLDLFRELINWKKVKKEAETAIKDIQENINIKFGVGKFENDELKITKATQIKKGGFDLDKFKLDHPTIDFSQYYKPSYSYTVLRTKEKD